MKVKTAREKSEDYVKENQEDEDYIYIKNHIINIKMKTYRLKKKSIKMK